MRKETDAERASARFSIRFMTGFSLLAVLVAAFSGDYMDPYRSEVGQVVMLVLAATFVGLLGWVRVDEQRRLRCRACWGAVPGR